jgi:hypothetical protein
MNAASLIILNGIMLSVVMSNVTAAQQQQQQQQMRQYHLRAKKKYVNTNGTESTINRALDGSIYPG